MTGPCSRCRVEFTARELQDGRRCRPCWNRAFEGSFGVLLAGQPAPLRLTARGRRLVGVFLLACLFGGLIAAYLVGQDRRCDALREERSPLVATYCPTSTPTTTADSQENP